MRTHRRVSTLLSPSTGGTWFVKWDDGLPTDMYLAPFVSPIIASR